MTTNRRAFSTRNTANLSTAQRRSAEINRCPSCDRKAATSYDVESRVRSCRYCGWAVQREV